MTIALERPGASGDQGIYADRIELQGVKARFPLPDFSGSYKHRQAWGYVRVAGMLRPIKWDDISDDQFDLSGDATGWGLNLSSNIKPGKDDVRLQLVFGEGIENYMNDSPVDVAIVDKFGNPVRRSSAGPSRSSAWWPSSITPGAELSSAVGYSSQDNENTEAQAPSAFRTGHYALGNLLYTPCRTS